MRYLFASDRRFYAVVGAATISVFVLALVGLAQLAPVEFGLREVIGLVAGFSLFMLVFFVSYAIRRLEDIEGL